MMKKLRYLFWTLAGAFAIMAGCAFMDLVWSNVISRQDLERSNNITGVETCREMLHQSFQTWLIFNPPGYQTYYLKSECFQKMAVRNRDLYLCNEVRERKSLYFNGSAVSPEACRELVQKKLHEDAEKRVRPETIHQIRSLTVRRTPEGGADVRVATTGSLRGTYRLSLSLQDAEGHLLGSLGSFETHLGGAPHDSLGTMVYRRDLQRAAGPHYRKNGRYVLTVSLELLRDDAGQLARSAVKAAERLSTAQEPLPAQ